MTQKILQALCATLIAWPALSAQTQAPQALAVPMSMQQVVDRALANNPALASARAHLSAVRATELTARARQNPTLTLLGQGVTLPEVNNAGGNPFYYSANVSRLFERGKKRGIRMEAASDTAQVTESQLRDQQRQLILSVRTAFTNMLGAKAALGIAEDNLASYRKTVDLTKTRLDAGDVTRTDYERIDLEMAQFETDVDTARLNLQQASAEEQQLLGVDHPSATFDITGTLDLPSVTLTMADAEALALAARPDYKAALQSVALAEANARYAVAGGTADPTLASEYERNGIDNTFGFSVSIPLRIFDRNQGEKERTRYEVDSSRFAVDRRAQSGRLRRRSGVDRARYRADARPFATTRHYLDEAGRVRDNLQFSYRNGNSTLLDYLDALRDYRAIHLSSLNANAQVWLAHPPTQLRHRDGHPPMKIRIETLC